MLEAQRAAFFADLPVPLAIRRDRLRRAALMIGESADTLCAALAADQANQDIESAMLTEVVPALATLRASVDSVGRWIRPEGGRGLFARLGGGDYVEYQPVGVIGIAAPASLPLLQTASILASVLAAGNRVTLKFDDASPELGRLIGELAPRYFDPLELRVASGDAFAEHAFDLLVTSEPQEGDAIMMTRSGKSPVIIGRSADFAKAADKVIAAKHVKNGRAPLAPDYLFVPEEQEEAIGAWLWRAAMRPGAAASPAPMDTEQERLARLLDDARARGGEVMTAEPRGAGAPLHIIRHASEDMLVMREDIQGPILPLRNYARIEDAIAAIHRRPPPLAIYYFGRDAVERRHVLERTLSSAIAIDGRALSAAKAGTGMTLHIGDGEAGFRRFSRARQVCRQPFPGFARAREGGDDLGGAAPALR
ncbi:MAG TPA: aldehyde dehydrogenase family protein [Sphingopyxis sp.]|uniref:aldehyde dehydrogenase family protein n=1 Tax=Sphingopyxis sp. TaxID=1908224 RepID=UPI002C1137B0|nr:aldehyde dehydrogenase family protein [Sphingopyxis sp.]HWW57779.1 aldehyde dehydrogenase family protein [Sphingopyxis sp.]